MDKFWEAELGFQAQKIPLMEKMVICLERIAYHTLPYKLLEFEEFKEKVLYASTGSEVQIQEGHEDTTSVRPRKSRGSKKHEDRSDTHPGGIRSGQEDTEETIRMANQELLEACGD